VLPLTRWCWSLRKLESYLGGRLARRLAAAPSAVGRASPRCRPHPQWLIRARLWAKLWMTCAYVPRICAQRGDNAVGFPEARPLARPLPGQRPSTPCVQGEMEMCPQRSLHQCIR
jgi:hypothetical protein